MSNRRFFRAVVPVVLTALALVGLGSSLDPPQATSRSHERAPEPQRTAVPTPAVLIPVTATAAITTTAAAKRPQADNAPPVPATDQWHTIFNRMAAELPGTYVDHKAPGCPDPCWGNVPHDSDTAFIDRRVPANRVADVMRHESGHIRQTRVYGTAAAAYAALKAFGGWEAVADCMARMIGARWTNYVKSCTAPMNHAARAILNGVPA